MAALLKLPFNSPNHTEINKKEGANLLNFLFFCVGVPGFEPGTPCSQSRCANRTALHPESSLKILFAVRTGLEPATPCVTGMYSNQLNYRTIFVIRNSPVPFCVCKDRYFFLFCNSLMKIFTFINPLIKRQFYSSTHNR